MPILKASLLTGGGDKPYALGLLEALISRGMIVDFIGSDEMSTSRLLADKRVIFFNLRGDQNPCELPINKVLRVLKYYWKLLEYVSMTDSRLFHILWHNKFVLFDRTFLIFYYKLLGKKVVFTAHNINERERDGRYNILNKLSLKILYDLVDHIFVHSLKMKSQLIMDFYISETKISVIPFGINNTLPISGLTRVEAKAKLNLESYKKVILFFGNIAPYKGLEYAISAINRLRKTDDAFCLVIGGQIKACHRYWESLEQMIRAFDLDRYVMKKIQYIPDDDVEAFFKAADVLVLPYKFIYQSGVLFLAYSFGLPVIASDVGSLREDIVEGMTGMICKPRNADDLAEKIRMYFDSDLFRNLEQNRMKIIAYGNEKYSWEEVGNITSLVYKDLLRV